MPKYIFITGSKDWKDYKSIENELLKLEKDVILIHGGTTNIDKIVHQLWNKMGGVCFCRQVTQKEKEQYGKLAGYYRNESIIRSKDYPLSSSIVFCKNISKGTMKVVSLLNECKIPITLNMVMTS